MKSNYNIGLNEGIVKIDNKEEGFFSLFNGNAWLTTLNISNVEFTFIKKNKNGLFKINDVGYYPKESVIHNPLKCCKCGFIPVEFIVSGFFFKKYYCLNCKKWLELNK